jgi:hypothetical protein
MKKILILFLAIAFMGFAFKPDPDFKIKLSKSKWVLKSVDFITELPGEVDFFAMIGGDCAKDDIYYFSPDGKYIRYGGSLKCPNSKDSSILCKWDIEKNDSTISLLFKDKTRFLKILNIDDNKLKIGSSLDAEDTDGETVLLNMNYEALK